MSPLMHAGLILAALARLAAADVAREVILPNHSPMIVYSPYSDGIGPELGWSIWSSEHGFHTKVGEAEDIEGEIRHVSALSGASFALEFYGTGITLTGETNATYQVTLDGTDTVGKPIDNALYSRDGLDLGEHSITLTLLDASNDGMLWFSDAVIATSSPTALKSVMHPFYDNAIEYNGTWTVENAIQGTWKQTQELYASASLTFANARAVAVHSLLNLGHTSYAVELDGTIMLPPGRGAFNASAYGFILDSLLFFKDNLDSSKEHTLSVTHLSDKDFFWFTITSFEVWQVDGEVSGTSSNDPSQPTRVHSGGKKSGGLSAGVYAGITIGVLATVLLVAAAVVLFLRKRRSSKPRGQFDPPVTSGPTSRWGSNAAVVATTVSHSTGSDNHKGGRILASSPTSPLAAPSSTLTSNVPTSGNAVSHEPVSQPQLRRFTLEPPAYHAS